MPRTVTITTPENVRIEYELAGIASRGGAALVDLVLQAGVIALLYLARYVIGKYAQIPGVSWGTAVLGVMAFVVNYGYYLYFETVWSGQTPGKRIARMRAVREGGLPIDLSCAALRNLVRIVDFLPVLYVLGGIVVLASRCNKRLGDYAAGTLVVKERPECEDSLSAEAREQLSTESGEWRQGARDIPNLELVSAEDFAAIGRFLERQAELDGKIRDELAARIAGPLIAKLGIEDNGTINYLAMLAEIYRRCVAERGML